MTAKEFLRYAGVEPTESNLYHLTNYVDSQVDFSWFPDATVVSSDGDPLEELMDEPADFQEYLERQEDN